MAIIKGDSWKKALRNAVDDETPMRRMIHKLPGGWSQNNCCVMYIKSRYCLSDPHSYFGLCVCNVYLYIPSSISCLPHGCTLSVSPPSQMWLMLFLIAV